MKKSVRRWVYLINVVRALPFTDLHYQVALINDRELKLRNLDVNLEVTDNETNELLVIFSEDGQPIYLSDWMKEPVEWDCYDFPMYEEI